MRKTIPHILVICAALFAAFSPLFAPVAQAQGSNPEMVNIPGTHQDELGCPGEWMPDCENTLLTYDNEDDVWQGTYEIQPANDSDKNGPRYKVALNGNWTVNYGANASAGGADIPLLVSARQPRSSFIMTIRLTGSRIISTKRSSSLQVISKHSSAVPPTMTRAAFAPGYRTRKGMGYLALPPAH